MDKGILNILAPIGGMGLIVVLILWIVAMVKEPKITGYYKFLNIYGRIYAYFAVDMLFAGFAATVMGIIMIFEVITGHAGNVGFGAALGGLVFGLVPFAIGIFMYRRVYQKSPDFMKKRCLRDLTISGWGTAMRVALWFLSIFVHAWWESTKPTEYKLENGQTVYVFPDNRVYDPSTGKFGEASSNRKEVVWNNY